MMLCVVALCCGCAERESGLPGIANCADMLAFARAVNAGAPTDRWQDSTGVVRLLDDIDLSRAGCWNPMGYDDVTAFRGVFDGGGHLISGLHVESDSLRAGLFGKNRGTIRGIVLDDDCRIEGRRHDGFVGAVCGENHGTVEACTVRASVVGAGCAGGVVGRSLPERARDPQPVVSKCLFAGELSGAGTQAGGVVGWSWRAVIDSCVNDGTVSCSGWFAGGICGVNGGDLSACGNRGSVSCTRYAGGVAGANSGEGAVIRSVHCANVAGEHAGALVGEAEEGSRLIDCRNEGTPSEAVGEDHNAVPAHVHSAACGHRH